MSLLAGCPQPGATTGPAHTYAQSLEPLLDENGLVAERLLETAAEVYNGKAASAEVKLAWAQDVVPLAEHLRDQAVLVQPPVEYADDHKQLVEIWSTRADAYREIADALRSGDMDQWKKGREQADDAKLREEAWFRATNEKLSAHGVALDQFP